MISTHHYPCFLAFKKAELLVVFSSDLLPSSLLPQYKYLLLHTLLLFLNFCNGIICCLLDATTMCPNSLHDLYLSPGKYNWTYMCRNWIQYCEVLVLILLSPCSLSPSFALCYQCHNIPALRIQPYPYFAFAWCYDAKSSGP